MNVKLQHLTEWETNNDYELMACNAGGNEKVCHFPNMVIVKYNAITIFKQFF